MAKKDKYAEFRVHGSVGGKNTLKNKGLDHYKKISKKGVAARKRKRAEKEKLTRSLK